MHPAPNAYPGHQSQVGIRTRPWGLGSRMSRVSIAVAVRSGVCCREMENRVIPAN